MRVFNHDAYILSATLFGTCMISPFGTQHGGVKVTLADMGCAVMLQNHSTGTINFRHEFLKCLVIVLVIGRAAAFDSHGVQLFDNAFACHRIVETRLEFGHHCWPGTVTGIVD